MTAERDVGSGSYSIRVMARLTGVPADTLRMWERRYGFPKPGRSATKIRAYSQDDLERLQLVTQALAQGHRPGQVVPLERGELERLVKRTGAASPAVGRVAPPPRPEPATVSAVVEALLEGDLVGAQRLVRQAVGTLGARAFLTDFAYPLTVHVGELWARGVIDIRHEHVITDALSTQLRVLLATLEGAHAGPTVLLATLPGEEHLLGAEMTALFLALEGALPRLLGTPAPVDQIAAAARELGVEVVGLSLVRAATVGELDAPILALRAALPKRVEVWLGGAGASSVTIEAPHLVRFASWDAMGAELARLGRRSVG